MILEVFSNLNESMKIIKLFRKITIISELYCYDKCGGLTLAGCQVPTQLLCHSHFSAGLGRK